MAGLSSVTHVRKRDGRVVPFEPAKIAAAIAKAFAATGEAEDRRPQALAEQVVRLRSDRAAPTDR